MSGLIKLTSRWQQVTHAKAIMGIPMMIMIMIMKTAMMLIMLYATIIISSMIITKAIYYIYAPKSIIILRHSGTSSLRVCAVCVCVCEAVKLNQSSIISLVLCMRILNLMAGLGQTDKRTDKETNR